MIDPSVAFDVWRINGATFDKLRETLPGATVVQCEAGLAFFLHTEARRLHLGEGEAKVLV